jgi:hypothetical protein
MPTTAQVRRRPADISGMQACARRLVLGTLALALAAPADADLLCRKKAGAVVLRTACAKREARVDLATLGALGPQGPQGPQVPAGAAALLKDAAGKLVGPWMVMPAAAGAPVHGVVRTLAGVIAFVPADAVGFRASGSLYYESSDCMGPAFQLYQTPLPVVTASISGTTAYVGTGPVIARSFNSYEQFVSGDLCALAGGAFTPPDRCCATSAFMADAQPATAVDLSALELTPPFHAELP